jgi:hypothetical protein
VQQALKERGSSGDRRAAAGVIKKLVAFNAIVVTPLLERVRVILVCDSLTLQARVWIGLR